MDGIKIHAIWANGQTLEKFAQILKERMEYMNETARGSVAACALNVLRSLRSIVLVAKPNRIRVEVKRDSSLEFSYFSKSKKRIPCLRVRGSNVRYRLKDDERFVLANKPTPQADKIWQIYRFTDEFTKGRRNRFIVASPNLTLAKQYAKDVIARRIMRYSGLAKAAIGKLMQKTFNKSPAESATPKVARKANEVTRKSETVQENKQTGGGTYTLTLMDGLKYAQEAIRGGRAAVDTQMKKALNKIVATINQKLKKNGGLLGPNKLDTPFPEVRKRK